MASAAALVPLLGLFVVVTVFAPLSRELGDEPSYLSLAHNLVHGYYADVTSPSPVDYFWHGPGLPLLLVPVVALGLPTVAARLTGPILLYLALVAFVRLTERYVSRRTALRLAYALGCLYLPFWTVLGPVHVEPLAILLFTLGALLLVKALAGDRHAHLWMGVSLGALALSRIEYGWTLIAEVAIALLWLGLHRRSEAARRLAVGSLVALAVCAPWLLYTYSLTGEPLYWGNSGGLSLYWMSAPLKGNLGDWHPPLVSSQEAFGATTEKLLDRPLFARITALPPLEQDARLREIAVANILRHPGVYAANLVNNTSRLIFNFPYSFTPQQARPLIYSAPNAVLLGALVVSAGALVRRRRLPTEVAVVGGLVVVGFAVHIPVSAFGRFTLPLVPAVVWLVTVALHAPRAGTKPEAAR